MAEELKPRIKAPEKAAKGELIEIKTLVSHTMESGQRKDSAGKVIPRKIINKFTCTMNGQEVFNVNLEPAIAANPYIAFYLRAETSGTLEFTWVDDDGSVTKAQHKLTVG